MLVILDRDGVINEDSDAFIKSLDEWHPSPGSIDAIARLSGHLTRDFNFVLHLANPAGEVVYLSMHVLSAIVRVILLRVEVLTHFSDIASEAGNALDELAEQVGGALLCRGHDRALVKRGWFGG